MNDKKTHSIAVIGITELELRMLKSTFWLSRSRLHTYVFADSIGTTPDLFLVDADNPQSVEEWQALSERKEDKLSAPAIMITCRSKLDSSHPILRRPLLATRVLGSLDQAVEQLFALSPPPENTKSKASPFARPAAPPAAKPRPRPAKPVPAVQKESTSSAKAAYTMGFKRVLVVDDSLPIRKQIEIELKAYKVDIDLAETGERAFELLNSHVYDLVLLDVVLPGVDGYEICKTIKKDKYRRRTPVVMLTGKSSPFDRVKGKLSGCNAYLVKPVQPKTFQKIVKQYILD